MHPESLATMTRLIGLYADNCQTVLDVGAYDFNGNYRSICEGFGLHYTGADLQPGPNVDRIMDGTWIDDKFDLVISGQTLEHCRNPFTLTKQICNHARHVAIIIVPWYQPLHRYPIDAWRVMPDGMQILIEDAGWVATDVGMDYRDTWGVAIPKATGSS